MSAVAAAAHAASAAGRGETVNHRSRLAVIWGVIGIGTFSVAAGLAQLPGHPAPSAWRFLVVGLLFLLGDVALLHIRFGDDHHSFTLSELALVVGLVLLPSPYLRLVAPLSVAAAHLLAKRPPLKVAFNAMSFAAAAPLAREVYIFVAGSAPSPAMQCIGLALASLAFFLWNTSTTSAAVASSQGLPFLAVVRKGMILSPLVWLGNTSVGLLLVVLAASSPASLIVVPVLLGLLYFVYVSYLRAMEERDTWQVLQRTSRELLSVEPGEVANVVVDRTPALFGADFVELLLGENDDASTGIIYRGTSDEGRQEPYECSLSPSNPFWGRALAEREAFEVAVETAPAPQRRELESLGLARCVVAPLMMNDTCLGTLRIGWRGKTQVAARQMQVLTTFANHVSAAVHNTRLFATVRVQALQDPLTGLANRTLLLDRLGQALDRSRGSGSTVAVLFLDLDRFKVVNDSMGHDAGDQLLIAVAERIQRTLRPQDTAARCGGDEFIILCEDINGPSDAVAVAERVLAALSAPVSLLGQQLVISASVGIALANAHNDDAAGLLRDADSAMYEAKGRGPARWSLFDHRMRERAVARLELENDLRYAIQHGELDLHYQPNVRLSDEGVVGMEALVRWEHPERGSLPPAEFIALAEETGLILPLGAWVIETACRQLADWINRGCVGAGDLYISVNLSPHQLSHSGLVNHIAGVLMMTGLSPRSLCLEVTESALLDDLHGARRVLERLRRLGVRIALDDFGTGYSSLSYLQMLPVDILKLDRSFIARLSPDPRDRAVVAGMIDLAHALDITVVAEGVETEQQLAELRKLDCDLVQGFHFFEPQCAVDLDAVLMFPQPLRLSAAALRDVPRLEDVLAS